MALRLIFIAKSAITSMKPFHAAGLDELLLLTCLYAVDLLGRQTSHRTPSFSVGMLRTPSVAPLLPYDHMIFRIKATDHHSGNSHRGRLASESLAGIGWIVDFMFAV
jgi:hypothetical protein